MSPAGWRIVKKHTTLTEANAVAVIRYKQALISLAEISAAHLCRDFDGGDVGHWIHIFHGGVVRLSVGELHPDAFLVGHNVSVGYNETIAANDESRTI